jgi:hypothetical protein
MEVQHIAMVYPIDAEARRAMAKIVGQALGIYPGSLPGHCERCGLAVWIGPRVKAFKEQSPEIKIMCALCAVMTMGPHGEVASLNNPDTPIPDRDGKPGIPGEE